MCRASSCAWSYPRRLARRGLVLRADLLRPLAHWITPELEPKRFDTRFFVARMPSGQRCRTVGTEAELRLWVRPGDALEQGLTLMAPTVAVLEELAAHADVEQALAAERDLRPVMPRVVVDEDGERVGGRERARDLLLERERGAGGDVARAVPLLGRPDPLRLPDHGAPHRHRGDEQDEEGEQGARAHRGAVRG